MFAVSIILHGCRCYTVNLKISAAEQFSDSGNTTEIKKSKYNSIVACKIGEHAPLLETDLHQGLSNGNIHVNISRSTSYTIISLID